MGIKIDKDNTFIVSYSKRHPKTRLPVVMRRKGIKSKSEANRVLADLIVIVNDKLKRTIIPKWPAFLQQYLKFLDESDLMNGTIYGRRKSLEKYTIPLWNEKYIDQISSQDIHGILKASFNDKAESHKKYFIKCIRGAFSYAVDENLLTKNPTPLLKFKLNDKIKSVLNEEQIVKLLKKARELDWHWYSHYAVALYTGMRNGELYALTWDKVNLSERQILVNSSWSSKDGFKSTKSGDDRMVEIPKPLMPVLKELKLQSMESDFVLPRLSKWDKGEQARELRFFLKSVGLPEIRFHDLRASWATLLLGKGVAPSKVMSMGGWKDMDTMMIYMRKAGISIKGATDVLDGLVVHEQNGCKILNLHGT